MMDTKMAIPDTNDLNPLNITYKNLNFNTSRLLGLGGVAGMYKLCNNALRGCCKVV